MATKDEERKALEQIKAIIAGLGEDSYVGAAFTGCFALAEQNIENDFLITIESRIVVAEEKTKREQEKACALRKELDVERKRADDWEKAANKIKEKWRTAENGLLKLNDSFNKLENEYGALEKLNGTKDYELLLLKARLFDLMEKEKCDV